MGALLEHLGMGVEGLDAGQLGGHGGEDAVLDGIGELTHDGEGGVLHHVVHLVDGAQLVFSMGSTPKAARPDSTTCPAPRGSSGSSPRSPDPC